MQLPAELCKALLAYDSPMAIPVAVEGGAAIVVKVSPAEIAGFKGAAVAYRYALARYETGPVLCLTLDILDDLEHPFGLEVFLDVNKDEDLDVARRLVDQEELILVFYDPALTYHYGKRIAHREQQRQELAGLIEAALEHLETTVAEPDWYEARQRYQREVRW